ncbi:MAG: sterol carrier protein domain-containing protein, partial [Planctomycetota bacterium]
NESEGTGTSVGMDMVVTDMAWSSRAGLDHLSTFLRGFGSIVGNVVFSTPVESAMLLRLPDRRFQVAVADRFMCRITHLETAISSRGFRRDTAAEIGVVLTDPVITDHSGAWTIRVDAEGQGACVRGGAGGLELEARWLGPLYLGHVSARELRDAGLVTASDAICDAWDRVFGGFGPPAMVDMF